MDIAVLGAGGFIGSNLVQRLVAAGHDVVGYDVDWPSNRQDAWVGAETRFADLTDPDHTQDAVKNSQIVFHLAASMGGVEFFHSSRDFGAALYNSRITSNVLAAIGRQRGTRLVYASSACAAATEHQYLKGYAPKLNEKDLYWGTPDQLYGSEKRQGAWLCEKAPFDARVAIFHTVYGPYQEIEGVRMKFPSAILMKAKKAVKSNEIELFGDGSQLRSYLYVDDAIDRLIKLAFHDYNPGPVMIGSDTTYSCLEVAKLARSLVGAHDAKISFNLNNSVAPTGVMGRNCDSTKFRNVFGPRSYRERDLRSGLSKFLDWINDVSSKDSRGTPKT